MTQLETYLEEIEQDYSEHKLTYEQYRQCIKDVLEEFDEDND